MSIAFESTTDGTTAEIRLNGTKRVDIGPTGIPISSLNGVAALAGSASQTFSMTTAAANTNSTQGATTAYADRLTAGTLAGAFTTLSASGGAIFADTGFSIPTGNQVTFDTLNDADSSVYINYNGYLNGTTRYRSLHICNGKHNDIAVFTGSATPGLAVTGTIKGSTTIGVGNATPAASGAGITFPATQSASSDANTLDDYEEGTWTPSFTPDAGSFTSITYATNRNGSYTKIGNQVFISGYIRTDAITVGTASGPIYIEGLPFVTSANLWRDTGSIGYADAFNVNHPCTIKTVPSTDRLAFSYTTTANGAHSTLLVSDLATSASSNFVFFSAAYTV